MPDTGLPPSRLRSISGFGIFLQAIPQPVSSNRFNNLAAMCKPSRVFLQAASSNFGPANAGFAGLLESSLADIYVLEAPHALRLKKTDPVHLKTQSHTTAAHGIGSRSSPGRHCHKAMTRIPRGPFPKTGRKLEPNLNAHKARNLRAWKDTLRRRLPGELRTGIPL